MSKVFKKLGLILTLFAAVLMMTGCPGPQSVDPEKCTVTFYAEVNAAGLPVTVTKGDTLKTIEKSIPVPAIDGFDAENFVSWVTANGNTFSYNTPIVSDISLYAKFKKKTISTETHTEEETAITDGSSGEVITEIVTSDEGTITETTETITNPNGEITVIETTATEDADGNITIEEKVTDPEGNTTSQVTTPVELTVDDLIELGLKALAKENISTAKAYFNAAYDKDSTNDKALLYSALSDLSSIITNYEIQKFFENHIGIKNYPSTLDGLISGKWLRSDGYTIEKKDDIWGCEFSEVKNPQYGSYYYYKAKETNKTDSEPNVYYAWPENYLVEINGTEYVTSEWGKNYYDSLKNGRIRYIFGGNSSIGYATSSHNRNVELDDDGEFFIYLQSDSATSQFTAYEMGSYKYLEFTYPFTYIGPELNTLDDQSWFAGTVRDSSFLSKLIVANILNGNTNGLDSAIDDLYSAIYESKDYKNACAKIDAIKTGVEIPAMVVNAFDLEEVFGTDSVIIGVTELTLIKDVLNWYKGLLEYLQSYSFSYDFSIFKEHWSELAGPSNNSDPNAEPPYAFLLEAVSSYNASLDPIANGLLSVRNEKKIEASKNTFLGIFNDVIASYDNIIAEDSEYPAFIKGFLGEYSNIRDLAVELKDAIKTGKKVEFSIEGIVTYIDFGKFFTSGQLALDNLIEIEKVTGAKAAKAPVFYTINTSTNKLVKISDAQTLLTALEAELPVFLHVKAFDSLNEITNAVSIMMEGEDNNYSYIPFGEAAAFVFNFYYGGLEELLAPQNAD